MRRLFRMRTLLRLVPAAMVLSTAVPAYAMTACTMDAKLCPDGKTYVGRDGNNDCAWEACPGEDDPSCAPYVCMDGTTHPSCSEDGHVINYFAEPCLTHGGDAGAFSDVPPTHANAEAIGYVKAQGIVQGYADGTFRPDATINRAEFVKILVEAVADVDGPTCKIAPFPDVDQTQWYATYAHKARCLGLVQGYPDGTFHPTDSINFVEAAKILSNAYGILASTTLPACESAECPWYRDHVLALETRAAIPTSVAGFDQSITRGEMAETIYRLHAHDTGKPSSSYLLLEANSAHVTYVLRYNNEFKSNLPIEEEYDGMVIAKNDVTGEETVIVPSIKDALPELRERWNVTLDLVAQPSASNDAVFFKSVLKETDNSGGTYYSFDPATRAFTKLYSQPAMPLDR